MFFTIRFRHFVGIVCTLLIAAGIITIVAVNPFAGSVSASTQVTKEGIKVPAVMYHGMLKDSKSQGKYVISPDSFEKDLQYLKSNGYSAVGIEDLLNYVDGKGELPEKPILLTFDDGYYNNYLYAYPLAKKYEMKIIISPIGYYTDLYSEKDEKHPNYSHITWTQIKEMMDSGYVEFQNHTYNLHASNGKRLGAKKLKGETDLEYQAILREDLKKLQEKMLQNTGFTPSAFVYPFGATSDSALPVIKELGFRATLTCESKMNYVTHEKDCLFGLARTLRPPGQDSVTFFKKLFSQS